MPLRCFLVGILLLNLLFSVLYGSIQQAAQPHKEFPAGGMLVFAHFHWDPGFGNFMHVFLGGMHMLTSFIDFGILHRVGCIFSHNYLLKSYLPSADQ